MQAFNYHAPQTLEEAFALLSAPGENRPLAGGTDLFLALEHASSKAPPPGAVIDLKQIPGLDDIHTPQGQPWRIGALTPMAHIEGHPLLQEAMPALCAAAAVVGGPAIRNRATLGGNLCNASPAADTSTPLLALDATVLLASAKGERRMPLASFWLGPRKTALEPGELLTGIELPAPTAHSGNAFQRVTRSKMDIAIVNAAAALRLDESGKIHEAKVSLGAVGPTVLMVQGLEDALAGKTLAGNAPEPALLATVADLAMASAQPIDDVRATSEYRRDLAGTLAARAFAQALAHAQSGRTQ